MSTATPASRRDLSRKNSLDMLRSLGLIGLVVACVFWLVPRPEATFIPKADVKAAAEAARSAGDVPVVVPAMPPGWQVTSARREAPMDGLPSTWHVGYLTDSGEYAGLKVTGAATDAWLNEATVQAEDVRTPETIDGTPWATWVSPKDGRVALVKGSIGTEAMVVGGTAGRDELVELASAAHKARAST